MPRQNWHRHTTGTLLVWSPDAIGRQGSFVSKGKPAQSVAMRILVVNAPPGVRFAVQRGRSALLEPSAERHDLVQFEFSLRLGSPLSEESVSFAGEFAQGPPSDRFIYINAGTLAGQADSCWTRRAKLKLASIPRHLIERALSDGDAIVEARVHGTMPDGGPVCASVKPQAVAWSIVRNAA